MLPLSGKPSDLPKNKVVCFSGGIEVFTSQVQAYRKVNTGWVFIINGEEVITDLPCIITKIERKKPFEIPNALKK